MKKSKTKTLENKKILIIFLFLFLFLFFALILRIGYWQFVQGTWLSTQASTQQTTTRTIAANRGVIYDNTGKKALAISAVSDTIYINPAKLKNSDDTELTLEFVVNSCASILGIDYTETLTKLTDATSSTKIASKVENEQVELLKEWMDKNEIVSGITIESGTKRYYPYNNLASSLIGFTGTDNHGLVGLEYTLDDILSGTPGKVVTLTDSINGEIPNQEKSYIEAENGSNVYLTIDVNIQSIAEKYLSQAVADNYADGGTVIIMEPSTGNILAMASNPDYDLNTPFVPTDSKLLENWTQLSSEEQNNLLYTMWNNTAVQSTYEPGSTFKLITAATALEEGIVEPDSPSDFNCTGYEQVGGTSIACWKYYDPHHSQNLRQALANSCNPAFIQLGQKVGATTLYKYYSAFGLFEKTNSILYGEQTGIFYNLDEIGDVELATMSFGQRFTITPLQLITAVSAIANEGVLMKPQIVSQVVDTNTGAVAKTEPVAIRQVISKTTAEEMMSMLEYVVTKGTGKHAAVSGYSVGGKSGTSEPLVGDENSDYIASFIGLSPTVNTQVVVLVILYAPKGDSHQGGQVCGPVVSQILSEVLPCLGIVSSSNNSDSNTSYTTHTLPDVTNKSLSEAKEILENLGFIVHTTGSVDATTIITEQTPKPGIDLMEGSDIFLYTENNSVRTSTTVPNFKGKSAAQAINSAKACNLNVIINGSGIVISQNTATNTEVEIGSVITLTLQDELDGGY